MLKKMFYCDETRRFQALLKQNEIETKDLIDEYIFLIDEGKRVLKENGFSWLGYKKSGITLPEYEIIQEKQKKIAEQSKEKEHAKNVILIACSLKVMDLKQNITADFVEVLESLKMRGIVNLTDIRKEKIKNELLKKESFSKKNRIFLYKDNYSFSLHLDNQEFYCSDCLKIDVYDYDFKNKPEKVSVLKDSEYLDKADDFVTEYEKLKETLENYNSKLKTLADEIGKKFDISIYFKHLAELED